VPALREPNSSCNVRGAVLKELTWWARPRAQTEKIFINRRTKHNRFLAPRRFPPRSFPKWKNAVMTIAAVAEVPVAAAQNDRTTVSAVMLSGPRSVEGHPCLFPSSSVPPRPPRPVVFD
jgi:hypothetical protein